MTDPTKPRTIAWGSPAKHGDPEPELPDAERGRATGFTIHPDDKTIGRGRCGKNSRRTTGAR